MTDLLFGPGPILFLQRLVDPAWVPFFRLLSFFGVNWGVVLGLGLALWLWGRDTAYALAGAVFLEGVVNLVLNELYYVPRPHEPGVVVYEHVSLSSFPSGHVFTTAVVWGVLYARGRIPLWVAALPVLGVGVGRIVLGAHYLGDVLGGLAFAVALLAAHARLWPWVCRRAEALSFRALAGAAAATVVGALAAALWVIGTSPYEWGAVGVVVGAAVGFPLEYRAVRYRPGHPSPARGALRVAVGSAGVLLPFLAARLAPDDAYLLVAALTGAATLWAVLLAPWILARTGLAGEEAPQSAAGAAEGAGLGAR